MNKEQIAEFTEEHLSGENENDDFPLEDSAVVLAWIKFMIDHDIDYKMKQEITFTTDEFDRKTPFGELERYYLSWEPILIYNREEESVMGANLAIAEFKKNSTEIVPTRKHVFFI